MTIRLNMLEKLLIAGAILASLMIASLAEAEDRFFAVTAYDNFSQSTYSLEVSCNLEPDWTGVVLNWNPVPEATGYKVYWGKETGVYGPGKDVSELTTHTFHRIGSPAVTIICE